MPRILVIASDAVLSEDVSLLHEFAEISRTLDAAEHSMNVAYHFPRTASDLVSVVTAQPTHVIHFSGHGTPNGEIVLRDETGEPSAVEANVLREVFRLAREHVRCVVLNACYTALQADVIAEAMGCVVGMDTAVQDDAAMAYSRGFYAALGSGQSVLGAHQAGTVTMLAKEPGSDPLARLRVRADVDPSKLFIHSVDAPVIVAKFKRRDGRLMNAEGKYQATFDVQRLPLGSDCLVIELGGEAMVVDKNTIASWTFNADFEVRAMAWTGARCLTTISKISDALERGEGPDAHFHVREAIRELRAGPAT